MKQKMFLILSIQNDGEKAVVQMNNKFYDLLESNPVIAAIKDDEGLDLCCRYNEIKVVFILYGDICSLKHIVDKLHKAGKIAIAHIDLITGLSGKEIAVQFLKENTDVDGIISTKPSLIKKANSLSLYTILRVFVLDSMAFKNIDNLIRTGNPDVLEILPGVMPKIIKKVCKMLPIPIIAGGLISEREDVLEALDAGAISVSSTNPDVWLM